MPRMYVEGRVGQDGPRAAAHYLMSELDDEARKNGHRVIGDVTIYSEDNRLLGTVLRLEADVEPML
jgi:hypothetical protein